MYTHEGDYCLLFALSVNEIATSVQGEHGLELHDPTVLNCSAVEK
jgi:hypothetical protein